MDTSNLIKTEIHKEPTVPTVEETNLRESYQNYVTNLPETNESVVVEDLNTQEIHNSIVKTQNNIDDINNKIDVLDNNLTNELIKNNETDINTTMPPMPPMPSEATTKQKPTPEVISNLDNFVESIKQTQPIRNSLADGNEHYDVIFKDNQF